MPPVTIEQVGTITLYNGRRLASWIPEVAERIFATSEATALYLFGSLARDEESIDSDIDLLVVLPKVVNRHEDSVRILRELRDFPVPIDIVVVDVERLRRDRHVPGILRVAMSEGRRLEPAS